MITHVWVLWNLQESSIVGICATEEVAKEWCLQFPKWTVQIIKREVVKEIDHPN